MPPTPLLNSKRKARAPRARAFEVIEGRKPEGWQDQRCELCLMQMSSYTALLRAIVCMTTAYAMAEFPPHAGPLLVQIIARIDRELDRWPDIYEYDSRPEATNIPCRVSLLPPTAETLELLRGVFRELKQIRTKPHLVPGGAA